MARRWAGRHRGVQGHPVRPESDLTQPTPRQLSGGFFAAPSCASWLNLKHDDHDNSYGSRGSPCVSEPKVGEGRTSKGPLEHERERGRILVIQIDCNRGHRFACGQTGASRKEGKLVVAKPRS